MRYDSVEKDPEAFQGFMQAIMEFVGVLQTTAAARRECPAADLVTTWVQGAANGFPMTDSQRSTETGTAISGGAEPTRTDPARTRHAFAEAPPHRGARNPYPTPLPGA